MVRYIFANQRNYYMNRFQQLKEEEKRKSNKALPDQGIQILASTSDTEDETDEETKSTVTYFIIFI